MANAFDPHDAEMWYGGYYEAAIVIGSREASDSSALLKTAIHRLWSHRRLRPAALGDVRVWKAGSLSFAGLPLPALHRIYGEYQSSALGLLPFTSVVVREEERRLDWLYACLPLGGIPASGGFPFGDQEEMAASRQWREPLERELAEIVLDICQSVAIRGAEIGFEITGHITLSEEILSATGNRWVGYVAKDKGAYRYWPTNCWS